MTRNVRIGQMMQTLHCGSVPGLLPPKAEWVQVLLSDLVSRLRQIERADRVLPAQEASGIAFKFTFGMLISGRSVTAET